MVHAAPRKYLLSQAIRKQPLDLEVGLLDHALHIDNIQTMGRHTADASGHAGVCLTNKNYAEREPARSARLAGCKRPPDAFNAFSASLCVTPASITCGWLTKVFKMFS